MQPQDPLTPIPLIAGWLAASVAVAWTLMLTVAAQGLAVIGGGGEFIGVSLPPHFQVWALVNVPAVNFATTPAGLAYWLAGPVACLACALLSTGVIPRPSTVTAELFMIQLAWWSAAVGLGWLPLVDPWDGHLSRMLRLMDLPRELVWLAPLLAAAAVIIPTIRLMSLARAALPQLLRTRRLVLVLVFFGLPATAFVAGTVGLLSHYGWPESPMEGLGFLAADPRRATIGILAALLSSIVVAWARYPSVSAARLEPTTGKSVIVVGLMALVSVGFVAAFGAPHADGTVRSLIWSHPDRRNNIRPWIQREDRLGSMLP